MTETDSHIFPRVPWPRRVDRPDLRAAFALILLGIFFFSDFLFTSKNFYFRDILNFHYPLRRILIDSFARGAFPLWNPYIHLGQPLLANPNYLSFYPTNLLHLLFSFNYAFKLHFILHPVAAGLGMYFFQRRLGIAPLASFAGALVYEFSGTVLSFLNLYNIVPAVALMPWIAWAFVRALADPRPRRLVIFSLIFAVQVFAFEPLMIQCEALLLAGLAISEILASADRRSAIRNTIKIGFAGGVLAAGLAAVQVLPTLELISRCARGRGFSAEDSSVWSTHPMDLINLAVPNFFGNPFVIGYARSWGESYHHGREAYLVSCFMGAGTLLLCLLAFFSHRKRTRILFSTLSVLGLALALGRFSPVYRFLTGTSHIFGIGRYPSKYMLLVTFSASVLAALGLESLLRGELAGSRQRFRVALIGSTLAAGLAVIGLSAYWQFHPAALESLIRSEVAPSLAGSKDFPAIVHQLRDSVRMSGLFLSLCAALALAAPLARVRAVAPGLMCVLVAAELLPANLRLSPLLSEADVDFVPEVNAFLKERFSNSMLVRVLPPTLSLFQTGADLKVRTPNSSAAWLTLFYRRTGQPAYGIMNGIQYSLDRSIDYLNTYESDLLWRRCMVLSNADRIRLFQALNSPLLLSVTDLKDPRLAPIASFETHSTLRLDLHWINDTLPRAYFVSGVRRVQSHEQALDAFLQRGFPFGSTVVLEDGAIAERPPSTAGRSARMIDYGADRIVCEVEAPTDGYLVLLDSYYPGWKARVDGADAPVLRANYAFRGAAVPAGTHRVEFRYRPTSFYAGLGISLFCLLACLLVCLKRSGSAENLKEGR